MTFQWPVFSLPARVVPREDGKVFMPSWQLLRMAGRAERRCLVAFFKCFVALPASVFAIPVAVIALPASPIILPAAARRFANVKMGNTAFGFRRKM